MLLMTNDEIKFETGIDGHSMKLSMTENAARAVAFEITQALISQRVVAPNSQERIEITMRFENDVITTIGA